MMMMVKLELGKLSCGDAMEMELLARGDVETRLASGLEPCLYYSLGTVPSSNDGNDVEGYNNRF